MTYATNRQAAQQESTPEMYEFTSGSRHERLTSYPSAVTFFGNSFSAVALERSSFAYDSSFGSVSTKLKVPLNNTFRRFIATQPIEPTNLKIYRAITSDMSSYVTRFNGQVVSVVIGAHVAEVECASRSRYLKKVLPRIIYQAYCNHDIYDSECLVEDSDYLVPGTLTSVSGADISAVAWSNAAGYADGYFQGGRVVVGSDMRLVVKHVDDTLTLQIPFNSEVVAGVTVSLYPGCDGSPETCVNRFNNLEHFLGMPYIPSKNPCVWGFR